ncbi:MAG: 16S rRNA (guanine(527)-N(7))-methyltransferase RsmG [Planctomycetes bacterium]|nr:16S rRNA (guanine(527)-N(7))-methyltransferase RsmG [Planctomycetota bacterium]
MISPVPVPDEFRQAADSFGIAFDDGDLDRLGQFLALLLDQTQRMNLTAIRDPDEAWIRHVFDSLTLLPLIHQFGADTVADVGSGGGVPGIPLAICMPQVQVTLIEATGKKADFLRSVSRDLELGNVTVVADRTETLASYSGPLRNQFDVVTARAVGRLPVLLELTVPLARIGGYVLAVKGQQAAQEVSESRVALQHLRAEYVHTQETSTGQIVVIRKVGKTPKAYPRRPGEPKRAPLVD